VSDYGCHNREPFTTRVLVQDGVEEPPVDEGWGWYSAKPRYRFIELRTDHFDCCYTRSEKTNGDPQCEGCKWKSTNPDLEY
jgi:hypothetical protein